MSQPHKPQHSQTSEGSSPSARFIYFGTPGVASETLATLLKSGFVPTLVVTSPDAPKGRGLLLTPSPTKELATSNGIDVITPDKLDAETIAKIRSYSCDYALCVAYGKILPEELINAFPLGILNIHYSLLPKYRGATPLEGALLAGEKETGVTVQKMAYELDAGDIIAQEATPIGQFETARELRPRLISLGSMLLIKTLPKYLSLEITTVAQDNSLATYSRKLKKDDGLLDLKAPADNNWNKYRAFADTIGTYFIKDGKRMKITSASMRDGAFIVERVIPEGKREMNYARA